MLDFESLLIYLTFLGISYFFAYLYDKKKAPSFLFLLYLALVLISGLRYEVGFDYKGYVEIFDSIRFNDYNRVEIGFYYLNLLFSNQKNGFISVQICMAAATYLFLIAAFCRYNKNIRYSIFFLFAFQLIFQINNQERQGLAMAIFFYALHFLETNKKIKYVVYILLASLFHTSALILLLFIFYNRYPPTKIWRLLMVISFICSALGVFNNLASKLLNVILSNVPQYQVYLTYDGAKYTEVSDVHGASAVIICLFWVIVAFFISLKADRYVVNKKLLNIYYLGISLYPIFISFHLLERIFYYFIFLNVILASEICSRSKNYKYILFFLGYFVFIVFCLKNWGSFGGYPYKSIFSIL